MSKKSDRIAKKAAATVASRHKESAAPVTAKVAKVKEPKAEKVAKEGALPKLPKLPSAAKARKPKPFVACTCGCGTMTRSMWAPGHDARARGWAIRIERGILKMADVPANEQAGAKYMLAERKNLGTSATGITLKKGKATAAADAAAATTESAIPDVVDATEAEAGEAVNE